MKNEEGIIINKPAGPLDGYDGGLQIVRDARNVSGGVRGNVNCASFSRTLTGKEQTTFEWNNLMILDNYADAGENCGFYSQANKFGKGPTWGGCIEASDFSGGNVGGSIVGLELDVFVSSPDDGNRVVLDIVAGDKGFMYGGPKNVAGISYGTRVGTCNQTPWATIDTAHKVEGNVNVGFDFSSATGKLAVKLSKDQYIQIGDTVINDSGLTATYSKHSRVSLAISCMALILSIIALFYVGH